MREHGDYILGRCRQVLLFVGRGPWNDESLKQGSYQMAANINAIDTSRPWAQLSCLFGESLLPPSTYNLFVKQSIMRKQAGLQALAVVILDSDISNTIKQQLSAGYSAADINHAFFNTIDEAIQWLQNQNVDLASQSIKQFFDKNPI